MHQFITRIQLADAYGLTPKTLVKKLRTRGINLPPGPISPSDQQKIYDVLGVPETAHSSPPKDQ